MLSEKGQESAPFELLIAIIIMSFVIVVGFNAIQTLERETCKGTLDKNLEEIKSGIETVVKNKSKANVSFSLPSCYKEDESNLRVINRVDIDFCSFYCGGSVSECSVLQFSSPTLTNTKCLRISSATVFNDRECNPEILTGQYEVVNWKSDTEGIQEGQYTLIRQFNLFSRAPEICAYKRVR